MDFHNTLWKEVVWGGGGGGGHYILVWIGGELYDVFFYIVRTFQHFH